MSTLKVNSITPASAGSEDYFLARAWVNFNGTGTVAIRADGNVSSITDKGTGSYNINFSSDMVDANYSANMSGGNDYLSPRVLSTSASYVDLLTPNRASSIVDVLYGMVTVAR